LDLTDKENKRMALLRNIFGGLRSLFGKRRVEAELDEELRDFLETTAAEKMKSGMTREQALRTARIEMGGVEMVKDEVREAGWEHWFETLWQDLRYGLRMMRRTPVITAMALLSLALGIGANTAIFSLFDAVILRMLPVQRPQELAQIVSMPNGNPTFTNPLWEEIRDRQDVFSGIFAWAVNRFDLTQGGEAHNVSGLYVSGDYFAALGVRPVAGRLIAVADDHRGCSGGVVLSYGFWQEHYGGAQGAVESTLVLNNHPFPVLGVSAPGFSGMDVGQNFDVALPVCAEATIEGKNSALDHRSSWWFNIVGRRKPGISIDQATARLRVLSPTILAAKAPTNWPPAQLQKFLQRTLLAQPAETGQSRLRRRYAEPLQLLMAVVGLVLLIACANIASLMLARAGARRKEIAVRLAIGASRARLMRQLLTECILLSSAGALLGIFFARWGSALLVRYLSTSRNTVFLDLSPDWRVLAFITGLAVLTGLLVGILPALRSTRMSLTAAMKDPHAGDAEGHARFRPGRWIVSTQVAVSLVLLVIAVLFLRSFTNLLTLDAGFDRNNVLLIGANIHNANVPATQRLALYQEILGRLASLPGVTSASQSTVTPISGATWDNFLYIEGGGGPTGDDADAHLNYVSPGYFATFATPILRGRNFDDRDAADAPLVAVVNQTLVKRFFSQNDPLGKYVWVEPEQGEKPLLIRVVGVVKDAKYESLRDDIPPTAYFPITQLKRLGEDTSFEVRTAARPSSVARTAESAITGVNKSISLGFRTLSQQVGDSLVQERLLATLSGFFGALALLLSMIGLYGVLSYTVTQRQKEIGIRMALGAAPNSILRLVLGDVARVLAVGLLCGTIIALTTARFVQKMLFGLEPRDATTLALAIGVLAGVALFAGYLPARRASRLDPMAVLREE
jgi:putative ABC transport system permease protein